MSPTANQWRAGRIVVALGLGAGGFVLLIPRTTIDRSSLGPLVVTHTAVPGVPSRAKLSQSVDPSTSTFAPTKRAATRDPVHTGLYAREWYATNGTPPEVGIVLQVLPDVSTARSVAAEVRAKQAAVPLLGHYTATAATTFSVPGVPGSTGSVFAMHTSASSSAVVGYAYSSSFRVGRAIVSELSETADPHLDLGPTMTDVRAGARLLERTAPPASFDRSHVPTVSSIVYIVVALVLVAAVAVVPPRAAKVLEARRARRRARDEARARSQYLSRGRQTVRGRGAPPWAQPRKR